MATYNAPTVLAFVADLGSAYTVNSPNIIIYKPDGSQYSAAANVSPSGSANPHLFSAVFVPTMGGLHKGKFQCLVGSITYNFPFTFWVSWTDVCSQVRSMLGVSPKSVPDNRLDSEIWGVVTELTQFANLNPYWQFTTSPTDYQTGFDQGLVKLVASRVRPWIGGKRPTGEVTLMKKGNTTVQYSNGSPQMEFTLERQWWEQGMLILEANIPEIESAMEQDRYGDMVMSRGTLASGNVFPANPGWIVLPGGAAANIEDPVYGLLGRGYTGGNEF